MLHIVLNERRNMISIVIGLLHIVAPQKKTKYEKLRVPPIQKMFIENVLEFRYFQGGCPKLLFYKEKENIVKLIINQYIIDIHIIGN